MAEDEALGGAAAQKDRDLVLEFLARHQEPILGRPLDGIAKRADPARDDGDLVHLVDAGKRHGDEGVPHLVVGDDLALLGIRSEEHTSEPQSLMRISYAV